MRTWIPWRSILARVLLAPFSWLYALGWQCYLGIYRFGIKQPKKPHSPIICIGNLQVGGTGKTPATVHVADILKALGYEVVISCSGYGSPASEAARLAPYGSLPACDWGDEASQFRDLRPDVPLIVGRRRVLAAEICHTSFPDAVMLMDDGFQHLPLEKDLTIVLDPPVWNRSCLPAGPYREPWSNRKRADLVIPSEYRIVPAPLSWRTPRGELAPAPEQVDVLCALGQPARFLSALGEAGINMHELKILPDHDPLTAGNLLAAFSGSRPIAVTGKDWVKLRDRSDVGQYEFLIAAHEVSIEPQSDFREWLQTELNGITRKT